MNENVKILTVDQALKASDAIDELFTGHIKYQINIAYKLYQLKKTLNDISEYAVSRIIEVLPKLKENNSDLSESEQLLYQTILNSPIEVNIHGLTRNEVYCINDKQDAEKPEIELSLIENLEPLF